jgi:hypothetical protein
VALVLFKEPAARKGIPTNRNNPAETALDFVFNATFIDEMHDDAKPNRSHQGEQEKLDVHAAIFIRQSLTCKREISRAI